MIGWIVALALYLLGIAAILAMRSANGRQRMNSWFDAIFVVGAWPVIALLAVLWDVKVYLTKSWLDEVKIGR